MRVRYETLDCGIRTMDTVLEARNKFSALHELLTSHGVQYDTNRFKEKAGWVQYTVGGMVYRTSTKFG